MLDFAENESFIVQEAVQGFQWNNSQTIYPFVMHYIDENTNSVQHKAYPCISNHTIHDTVTVYTFVKKLLLDYLKPSFPKIRKVIYFRDGSAAQYKNYKNFMNLIFYENDFNLKAEWHFFATSQRKYACDGVGGTLKRLAAHASLQRLFSEQILTPMQLLIGVLTFFVNSQSVKENIPFLECRFSNCSTFKGTCKNHEFTPCGDNILMNCVSGGASRNLLIQ